MKHFINAVLLGSLWCAAGWKAFAWLRKWWQGMHEPRVGHRHRVGKGIDAAQVALFTLDFPVKSRSLVQFGWQRPWFPFWFLQAEHSIAHPWGQTVPSQEMEGKAWLWGQQLTVIHVSVMLHCWLGGFQGTQLLGLSLLLVHFKARASFYHSKSEFSALVFMLVWDIGSFGNKPGIGST